MRPVGSGRAALATKRYKGIADAVRVIYREEGGVRALYRGIVATNMVRLLPSAWAWTRAPLTRRRARGAKGVAPYVAINFTVYETLRKWVVGWRGRQPSANEKMVCGALAGVTGQTST
jgi:solute carrier family 25 (mitochondrial phosphate transporter), member 23/24/25/41